MLSLIVQPKRKRSTSATPTTAMSTSTTVDRGEDLEALTKARFDAYESRTITPVTWEMLSEGIRALHVADMRQALHSRGWRRREDVLEEAAVHAETVFDNDWQPSWKSAGYSIAEGIRALKDTP